jgi:peptidoglycan hydrolase CwlO-like protein
MMMNKAQQILINEVRKIKSKIEQKKKEIYKLEAELKEVQSAIK